MVLSKLIEVLILTLLAKEFKDWYNSREKTHLEPEGFADWKKVKTEPIEPEPVKPKPVRTHLSYLGVRQGYVSEITEALLEKLKFILPDATVEHSVDFYLDSIILKVRDRASCRGYIIRLDRLDFESRDYSRINEKLLAFIELIYQDVLSLEPLDTPQDDASTPAPQKPSQPRSNL